ncbi:phosphopantetheinyl transferase [Escherichia coli]|nr:phosphopantetheinyl transferase [Escherichia coli]OOC71444.1 phosphopantetheinyl transferase [Escherichia coli ATCC 8739]AQV68663.1 phosphopantetheinyl transferase [Escherichia coli]AQV80930.1 phosphopantetheinyl transferase [Escherichia coli]OKS65189.1 phosphopantetheinyl transferase [Escherichia coli]
MRRERLIRPTKVCKFNKLQNSCRPDKRSASGIFASVIGFRLKESAFFRNH